MTPTVYYNEIDPYCAQWLRNLMDAGHIPAGDIDTRSIEDVRPDDLRGYVQCHFFAGLGGWAYALALAGWPAGEPVWTGSCPCQPFSAAGKGAGFADERHLWPAWQHLIAQREPAIVFGEQVASKNAEPWIDLVHADMEGVGYAFGCVPFPSAGVGAPHIRDRSYWVADAGREGLAQRISDGRIQHETVRPFPGKAPVGHGASSRLGDSELPKKKRQQQHCGQVVSVEEAKRPGLPGALNGFWRYGGWIACADGKSRPIESCTQPLADGTANRVVRVCTTCLQKGSIDENLRRLLEINDRNERCSATEVLFSGMSEEGIHEASEHPGRRSLSGAEPVRGEGLQSLRINSTTPSPPYRREPYEQCTVECGDSLLDMPFGASPAAKDVDLRGMREGISSSESPQREQGLLCDMCGRMGAHLRTATLVGNRVGRLRAYGNAINAQAAAEFIRAYREARGLIFDVAEAAA